MKGLISAVRKAAASRRTPETLFVLALLFLPTVASACPVCFGAPGDPMVEGTNRGIWVLLGIVGIVQIGFAALFWTFWRRARDLRRLRDQFHLVDGGVK